MAVINREHKDRLFCFLFGNGEHKDWTLSLYNAVNESSYENPDDIQLTTMDDVLYMGMKNDVSFLVSDMLNIFEQQSTFNPNMPVRMLMYAGKLYDKYIHVRRQNIYSHTLVHLPIPKLVCFYNGLDEKEDAILHLSDAFETGVGERGTYAEYDIEVRVRMININYGHNREMMTRCRPLEEYAWLIDRIRSNSASMESGNAVDKAINAMPDSFVIRQCILANRAEVRNMCLTEYNEVETMRMFKEEWRTEGEDMLGQLIALLLSKGLTADAEKAASNREARIAMYKKYGFQW